MQQGFSESTCSLVVPYSFLRKIEDAQWSVMPTFVSKQTLIIFWPELQKATSFYVQAQIFDAIGRNLVLLCGLGALWHFLALFTRFGAFQHVWMFRRNIALLVSSCAFYALLRFLAPLHAPWRFIWHILALFTRFGATWRFSVRLNVSAQFCTLGAHLR